MWRGVVTFLMLCGLVGCELAPPAEVVHSASLFQMNAAISALSKLLSELSTRTHTDALLEPSTLLNIEPSSLSIGGVDAYYILLGASAFLTLAVLIVAGVLSKVVGKPKTKADIAAKKEIEERTGVTNAEPAETENVLPKSDATTQPIADDGNEGDGLLKPVQQPLSATTLLNMPSPITVDGTSTVHHGQVTHDKSAEFFFTVTATRGVSIAHVQCSTDNDVWEACSSPTKLEHLKFGAHTIRFRCLTEHGVSIGPNMAVTWTVLPGEDPNKEKEDASNKLPPLPTSATVDLLPPTLLSARPLLKNITQIAQPNTNELAPKNLVPSSYETRLKVIPVPARIKIDTTTTEDQEPASDPTLAGPFTEKQLIDLTPKQLRIALRMSPKAASFTPQQIMDMNPEAIRDIFRFMTKPVAVAENPFCKRGSPTQDGCPEIVARWPVKT